MTAAAALAEVTKRFPGGALALDRISLSVPEGEILVLLGTSGSGKTTALKTLNRLVRADDGRVTGARTGRGGLGPHPLRRAIGYVIQEVGPPSPPDRGRKHRDRAAAPGLGAGAASGARVASCWSSSAWIRTGSRPRWPAELSGGERQRVGLARALARRSAAAARWTSPSAPSTP